MKSFFFSPLAIIPALLLTTHPGAANPFPKNVFRPERMGYGYKDRVLPTGVSHGFPVGIHPPGMAMPSIPTPPEPQQTPEMKMDFTKSEKVDKVDNVDDVDSWE
ncbi:hypothetical protein EX30DRAFT_346097 [Ascodesmis nigricans]|uniref:Uncharacterized protein n=1 Tax=Ascodesmis nigricans TaxID=341454 RepID=A0A4V3SJW6_9PEZI|nr:hypothetical protein EX30DRAFT_346097 [Ascodesmis nigricans]